MIARDLEGLLGGGVSLAAGLDRAADVREAGLAIFLAAGFELEVAFTGVSGS